MLEEGRIPIYEPGLDVLVERHRAAGRLTFTTDLAAAIDGAEAVFIGVGTPSRRGDGHADLTYVFAAAEEIAASLEAPDPGGDQVHRAGRHRPQAAEDLRQRSARTSTIDIASNPEFLREGSAIEDFLRPDRVVCGVESDRAARRAVPLLPAA